MMDERITRKVNEIILEIKPIDEKEALRRIWNEAEDLQRLLNKERIVIMVAGNIGLGKTTTAKIVSTFGKTAIDMEDADKELLKLYYDEMRLFSERLQIDLIAQRLNQIAMNRVTHPDTSIIYDRTPYEDPLIFAAALHHYDQMSRESLDFCYDYFLIKKRELSKRFPDLKLEPDLLILLKANLENGWKRVNIRQRAMELKEDTHKGHGLTLEFYELLNEYYKKFAFELRERNWYRGPILTLEEDELEVADVTNTKGQLYVIKSVKEALKMIVS